MRKIKKLGEVVFFYVKYRLIRHHPTFDEENQICGKAFSLKYLKVNDFNIELIKSITSGNIFLFGKYYQVDEINWDFDYENEYDYGRHFYKLYRFASFEKNKDPKYVLELSRLNHIFYVWLFGELKNDPAMKKWSYIQLNGWITSNPIGMGTGWSCTMDVALRAINLSVIYLNDRDMYCAKLRESIWQHQRFILDNLENHGRDNNNHYLSDLAGLIFTSLVFNDTSICRFALNEFERELNVQVLNDGVDFEGSTTYHRFVLQLIFYVIRILEANNIRIPVTLLEKESKMASFINAIQENDNIPLFGDCDSSFILNMDDYESNNIKNIRSLFVFFEKQISLQDNNRRRFNEAGYYILSDQSWKAVIRCGRIRGTGGHYHNDQLSYVLYIDGEELFIDRGLYTYYGDTDKRNMCRSTNSHNCYSFDDIQQNEYRTNEIFLLEKKNYGEVLGYEKRSFKGRFAGYNDSCVFDRECKIYGGYFEEFSKYTKAGGEFNYYVSPCCEVKLISPHRARVRGKKFIVTIDSTEKLEVIQGTCFTAYMKEECCSIIRIYPKALEFRLRIYKDNGG